MDVEYASEYCYRSTHAATDPIVIVITQSGETADTLAAQREALHRGAKTVAIANVPDSTIARRSKRHAPHLCGDRKGHPGDEEFHHSTHGVAPSGIVSGSQTQPHHF